MKHTLYNERWKYWLDKDSFALVWDVPEGAREITLPHDAMIETPAHGESLNGGNTGFRDGDIYVYVKQIYVPESARQKKMILKFEGVYMNAFVYVNGQLAAKSPFGYTTFYAPLNDYLKYDAENEIRVQVRNGAMSNSRWYSGGGIYRDVYLLESGCVYLKPEGVQISTENADEEIAVLSVKTEIANEQTSAQEMILSQEIYDPDGKLAACEKTSLALRQQTSRTVTKRVTVEKPALWNVESPAMYTCVSRLLSADEKECFDEDTVQFGIRTLAVDAKRGLRINSKSVKLRGACIHHDSGLLGAATYEDAHRRQVRILKDAGFNAIRMSHHPAAPALLKACDELGMLVMDETFDMWNRPKSGYDYGLFFSEWWEKDVEAMVRKDYNHPSVIMYSIGNEIPEIGTTQGAEVAHSISSKVKELDNSRFTLASINGVFAAGDSVDQIVADVAKKVGKVDGNVNNFMTLMDGHMDDIVVHPAISARLEKACAPVDIAGYNSMTARYEPDGKDYPNRVIVGSETYPPEIARNWALVKKLPHVIGDFTWTGWDYIGEAGVGIPAYQWGEGGFGAGFPAQLAYAGDVDITGFRRPASYYREAVFGLRKTPYIAVQNPHKYGEFLIKTPWVISDSVSSWTWTGCEGKKAVVEVYAGGAEVELFINEKSVGRKPSGEAAGYRTLFEVTYEPGTVKAVAYEADGTEIGSFALATAKQNVSLTAAAEPDANSQLISIDIALEDECGTVNTEKVEKLTLTVEGAAKAEGFGSGNPKPSYNFNENATETFNGRAQAILKRVGEGSITAVIQSETAGTVTIKL